MVNVYVESALDDIEHFYLERICSPRVAMALNRHNKDSNNIKLEHKNKALFKEKGEQDQQTIIRIYSNERPSKKK